ncbi:hypothetical protein SY85_01960 [Flavisolibacter tropicus]|uniref:Uncharacterized protein n=1 Tax=Flavisolibacter tropicus TaxID=1492898 RepID=A0A172TR28_9BACT|nr:hypothetical protein SY85_01960 [Flavisolibacter tropicus]
MVSDEKKAIPNEPIRNVYRRSSECGRQVEGFTCAVGTDLPTEEVQIRYRRGTRDLQVRQGSAAEARLMNGEWSVVSVMKRKSYRIDLLKSSIIIHY